MIIQLAGLNIEIKHNYKYLPYMCKDYIINDCDHIDISISITNEEIKNSIDSLNGYPDYYIESNICYRKIVHELYKFDAIMLHGSSIKYKDKAYIFTAISGTGKSTHTELLIKNYPSEISYINGDKPIIRYLNEGFYVFGTPWNGKEGYGENTSALLDSIVYLERDKDNSVSLMPKDKIISFIIQQIIYPDDLEEMDKTLDILSKIINSTNNYNLKCNMEDEAAKCTYKNILNKELK